MKRPLGWLAVVVLALTAGAVTPTEKQQKEDSTTEAKAQKSTLPEPAHKGGYLQRGGTDIGRGYAHAGRELGRGSGRFGKNLAQREFGQAGRSMGRGGAEFGKGVGVGTARGFKNFGLALRNLGKRIDRSTSDDKKDSLNSN